MNKKIKTIQRHGKTFKDRIYIPAIIEGLKTTIKHLAHNVSDINSVDVLEYPEEQPTDITERYRGLHRLTHREDGTISCVACFMCATACPSACIFIEATQREDGVDEKMPQKFSIDTLECIFCGYCVEACPCDAIRMDTGIFSLIGREREDFLLDKEKLLSFKGAFAQEDSIARK
ncbi:MAG: 4Fe-4S dicluster domain-containing protein [Helicobacteraceae bacterium]|nr:4Fe-4S dicluster domain-containing protein [Helicobacteraceae bacterium]